MKVYIYFYRKMKKSFVSLRLNKNTTNIKPPMRVGITSIVKWITNQMTEQRHDAFFTLKDVYEEYRSKQQSQVRFLNRLKHITRNSFYRFNGHAHVFFEELKTINKNHKLQLSATKTLNRFLSNK